MIYQVKHTKRRPLGKNYLRLIVVAGIILVVVLLNMTSHAGSFLADALSPFFRLGDYFYNMASPAGSLSEKNALVLADYEVVKRENENLRKNLGLKPDESYIAGSIIGKPPQTPMGTLFLDVGQRDGINVGDLVLASDRVLIGKISEATENKSTVSLNSFAGTISYGFVERTGEPLEITGAGSGNLEARMPIDFDIEEGDKIMTNYSSLYLIALVKMVEKNNTSGFKNVFMSLPVDVPGINMVFVKPK